MVFLVASSSFFFFNDTATTEIYTLSLHDALPIFARQRVMGISIEHRAGFAIGLTTQHQAQHAKSRRINREPGSVLDRKSTRLNSSHANISYAVFFLKKKKPCGPSRSRGLYRGWSA